MKPILTAAILTLVITTALVAQRSGAASQGARAASQGAGPASPADKTPPSAPAALPPILMTCVHHPEVLESKAGACPYCKLPLVPVRLDAAWMCPVHTTVTESSAGTCRMCGRRLVPVTVSLTWTCAADPATEHLEPGTCANGSPRIRRRTLRAHGNHNPQHGGQFFMAPDNWHHLEAVHPSANVFRLYVYDDYGRPLSAAKVKDIQARVVTKEAFDVATRKTRELAAFPLKPTPRQPYLEARVDRAPLPAEMTAKVRFGGDQPEYRFDFTFASFSKEPVAPVTPRSVTQPSVPSPPSQSPLSPALAPATSAAAIPSSMSGMLEQLDARTKQVGQLIARGEFTAVWVPAFQAKDMAIALEPHLAHLSQEKRTAGEPALTRVVRAAWLLDAAGDVGNRAQIEAAYAAFTAAVGDTLAAFKDVR